MNALQPVLQFVISGVVVVGATLLAKSVDAKWAGLLVALPIMTILGFVFISVSADVNITNRYLLSALIFMVPAAVYVLSLYLLHERVGLIAGCCLSVIPLGVVAFVVQKFL